MVTYTDAIAKIHAIESENLVVCEFCNATVHPVELYTAAKRGPNDYYSDKTIAHSATVDYLCRTCAVNIWQLLLQTAEDDDDIVTLNRQMRGFIRRERVAFRKVWATVWDA